MLAGIIYALLAGLMWGVVFAVPLLLPEYPATLQSVGRYLAFGLIALPIAWLDRANLRELTRQDWIKALQLAAVGNLLYYLCLAGAIQRVGAPVTTMFIGALPVVIAICANVRNQQRDGRYAWRELAPALLLIMLGIGCVNLAEMGNPAQSAFAISSLGYLTGILLCLLALACWTWYPLHNADWLREHSHRSPRTWATAQGVATLPLALLGYLLVWGYAATQPGEYPMPFGPRPGFFVALMLIMALLASWCGTLCWNEASQRLPTTLAGQLIIFETLAALAYAYLLRHSLPPPLTLLGVLLLITGVLQGVRLKPKPVAQC